MEENTTRQTLNLIRQDLELPDEALALDENHAILLLSKAVKELLDRDFERMLQICYRIDLSEFTLKKILNESDPENLSLDLAKALWDRQKQKVEMRKRYS